MSIILYCYRQLPLEVKLRQQLKETAENIRGSRNSKFNFKKSARIQWECFHLFCERALEVERKKDKKALTLSSLCDWSPPRSQVLGQSQLHSCSNGPVWWGTRDQPSPGATLERGEWQPRELARRNTRNTRDTSTRCPGPQSSCSCLETKELCKKPGVKKVQRNVVIHVHQIRL
jgi:hypothetical protein